MRFWSGICSFHTIGIGIEKITRSKHVWTAAWAYQKAVLLMQVPLKALFHASGIGLHWKMVAKVKAIVLVMMAGNTIHLENHWNRGLAKIRR